MGSSSETSSSGSSHAKASKKSDRRREGRKHNSKKNKSKREKKRKHKKSRSRDKKKNRKKKTKRKRRHYSTDTSSSDSESSSSSNEVTRKRNKKATNKRPGHHASSAPAVNSSGSGNWWEMFEDSRGSKPSSIEALERKIKSARQNRTHLDAKALSSSAPKRQLTPQEQLAARKSTVPLTAEEYNKLNNQVRMERDIDGRMRMIKGFGQVLETIVTKKQQQARNKQATRGDGQVFSMALYKQAFQDSEP